MKENQELKNANLPENEYGRIYVYDYPYHILCFGALQSALAGVGLHGFVFWSLAEYQANLGNSGNPDSGDQFKVWAVLIWFLIDFLMGIFLLVATLCHWKGVFFRFWAITDWMTNIFTNCYLFVFHSTLSIFAHNVNIYSWFLLILSCIRFCSAYLVWHYSRLRDIRGPKVFLKTANCSNLSLKYDQIGFEYVMQDNFEPETLVNFSPFFANKQFAIIKNNSFTRNTITKSTDVNAV